MCVCEVRLCGICILYVSVDVSVYMRACVYENAIMCVCVCEYVSVHTFVCVYVNL